MQLNREILSNKKIAEEYKIPTFDINKVIYNTEVAPKWLHFGAGNIFRAFPAILAQKLLNENLLDTGIVCCESYDEEIIEKIFVPYDNLSIIVTLNSNGKIEKEILASITHALTIKRDIIQLHEIFSKPSLQIVSFTITEKGYSLKTANGDILESVLNDFKEGPKNTKSFIGLLTALCLHRFNTCKTPIALVSMDNCSQNGTILYNSVIKVANEWLENKFVNKEFINYLEKDISFPWSMIDKITPRPSHKVAEQLIEDGFENLDPIITSKNTYIAPFVNAEKPQYLIIENLFPNGKPNLEKANIIFTDRETVNKIEKMKVCTCLNPLHTALAIYGCLLGYKTIYDEMQDKSILKLISKLGYDEGLPVVIDPKIISPKDFLKEVLEERFTNPYIEDTPQRIATDTSQKLAIRFGETIKSYIIREDLDVQALEAIPFIFAGWLRYLMAIDDEGNTFELSPDILIDELQPLIANITIGFEGSLSDILKPILSNENIFGVDLYKVKLADKVETYFKKLIATTGAIREELNKF